jgi:hypothetical protein
MKFNFNIIGWAGFAVCLALLLFTSRCSKPIGKTVIITKPSDTVTVTKTDTVFTPYKVEVPVPGLTHEVIRHDTTYLPAKPLTAADTSHAVKDYYLKKFYRDSFTLEQAYVGINFEISQNKVIKANYQVKNKRLTYEIPKLKNKVLIGVAIGYSTVLNIPTFSPMVAFQNKSDNIIFAGYDIFHSSYQLGGLIKIKIGK